MTAFISRRKYKIFGMDIESHNDPVSIATRTTGCWLGCFLDENSRVDDERSYFYTIREFLERVREETLPKRGKQKEHLIKNCCVYIYNLSFEWSFILPVLLEMGFIHSADVNDASEMCYSSVCTKSCSSVWMVKMKFEKNCGFVILRDLAKMFPGGLGSVAKSFGLETQKGEIDYRKDRRGDYTPTAEEKEYCFKDTRIIIEILQKMEGDKDFFCSSSMASYSMRKLLKFGFPKSYTPYKFYRRYYPELDAAESEFLRLGVEGGIAYAPDRWQFKTITKPVGHIDMHQAHPTSAYINYFPYGKGAYFFGKPPLNKICACRVRISYNGVKLHSIIKLIGLPFVEGKEIVVWDFELATMKKCYEDLKIEYIDGYAYKMKRLPWRKYYETNYLKRLEAKKAHDDFNVLYYKLLNNSSYGKHLEKAHNEIFRNIVRPKDGVIDSVVDPLPPEDCKVNSKYTYIPVGSCIAAYSRVRLIETALKIGWQKIVYFDTDSIFFLWDKQTEKVWATIDQRDFLGGWGWEEMIDRCQFAAPKRYKTETAGKTTIKAGGINFEKYKKDHGIPEKDCIPFDEVNIISSKWQVQRAFRCRGGTIIEFQEKEMKVPPKYQHILKENIGAEM